MVSMDDKLVRRIDDAARAKGLSRSAYLALLAEQDLGLARGPGSDAAVKRAMAGLDSLFQDLSGGDATAAIRAERDAR